MFNIQTTDAYDVCIVGSGAGGGMAAKVLSDAGARIVMLEAGSNWNVADHGAMFTWNYESPRRGAATTERPFGEFDACDGGWEIPGEPYTRTAGTQWDWFRARMLGGRTNHWGRISLRFGPDDFKGRSRDGVGDDWPISYEDVKPYYDKVDRLIGIFGSEENYYNEPDGIFMPPPGPRCYERLVTEGAAKLGIRAIPSRLSILTQSLNGRAACHYCSQCNRGCNTHSNFSAGPVLIDPARSTGNLEVITNAMVREVLTDTEGRATGVSYINTTDRREYQVRAKIVILAASACESARLLLNSKSPRHPNGLGNSSDVVGKYLMDSTGTNVMGFVPALVDAPVHNCDGVGGLHQYIPWWGYDRHAELGFPRGYHFEMWGGRRMPSYGIMAGIERYNGQYPFGEEGTRIRGGGGYGQQLKEDCRRFYGSIVGLSGRGEMVARRENYCEIDPEVVDQYGIPVLRFHISWSDDERRQCRHMQETGRAIIEAMGGVPLGSMPTADEEYGLLAPGRIIHEVGVTRMGSDPSSSVVDEYCRLHDADNVFIVDGGPMVSQPHKNPTWTILALSMRASEHIVEQRSQLNI